MTPQQRVEALEKAAVARKARGELLAQVKSGATTVAAVLKTGAEQKDNTIVGRMRVRQVLLAVPGWGPAKVTELMARLEIAETRRVGALGDRQRAALIAEFG